VTYINFIFIVNYYTDFIIICIINECAQVLCFYPILREALEFQASIEYNMRTQRALTLINSAVL